MVDAERVGEREETRQPIKLRFCKESNDLLYPYEKKESRTLWYRCRNCDYEASARELPVCVYLRVLWACAFFLCRLTKEFPRARAQEPADNNCVYRNLIDHKGANKTVVMEASLSRPRPSPPVPCLGAPSSLVPADSAPCLRAALRGLCIAQDVTTDPTLPRTRDTHCPRCDGTEARLPAASPPHRRLNPRARRSRRNQAQSQLSRIFCRPFSSRRRRPRA